MSTPEDHILDDLFEEAMEASRKQQWRRDNPYVGDLIEVLKPHKDGLSRIDIVKEIRQIRLRKSLPIPEALDKTVQSFLQRHASGYAGFRSWNSTAADDLFYPLPCKGSGVWAVRIEQATAWLIAKNKLQ